MDLVSYSARAEGLGKYHYTVKVRVYMVVLYICKYLLLFSVRTYVFFGFVYVCVSFCSYAGVFCGFLYVRVCLIVLCAYVLFCFSVCVLHGFLCMYVYVCMHVYFFLCVCVCVCVCVFGFLCMCA